METIDLTKVAKVVDPDKKRLPYDKYKHLFTKVAFDVFQLNTSPVESYWILEKDDDGKEYLSANYEKEQTEELQAKSSWEALSDKESKNITLLYRGVPIKRFASSEYGFDSNDVDIFKNALVNKLSVSKEFVDKLIEVLTEEKRDALVKAFPELVS
jgi:hypothetical protein